VQLQEVPEGVLSSVCLAVIRLQQCTAGQYGQVFEGLRAAGIVVQLYYIPEHLQSYYRSLGFVEVQVPEAEARASSDISLPLFQGFTESYLVSAVRSLGVNLREEVLA